MFDEKKYREAFSMICASEQTGLKIAEAMRKKRKKYYSAIFRFAVICALAILLPAGTVYAYNYIKTVLFFHQGDITLLEPYVQVLDETIQKDRYKIHVDSTLSDQSSTIIGITVEALTEEAVNELKAEDFDIRHILCFEYLDLNAPVISMICKETQMAHSGNMRSFAIRLDGLGAPNRLRLYLSEQQDEPILLNLENQIDSLTVTAKPMDENTDYYIQSCNLNAMCVEFDVEFAEPIQGDQIVEIYFRMADGTLKTLPQLAGNSAERKVWHIGDSSLKTYRYTENFETLVNPLSVAGVIMNGTEYSFLDAEYAVPAEVPDSMRPFLTSFIEEDKAFYFCADDVCEKIGASLECDGDKYSIHYLETTILFLIGDEKIIVNGEEQNLNFKAALKGKELILPYDFFDLLGVRAMMYYPEKGTVHAPDYWIVTP